jgi:hypothetical protein
VPRVPSAGDASKIPSTEDVANLDPDAGAVVQAMHDTIRQARLAVAEVSEGRRRGRQAGRSALVESLEAQAREAWAVRGTGRGVTLAEQVAEGLETLRGLRSLSAWLAGRDMVLDRSGGHHLGFTPEAAGNVLAVSWQHTGRHGLLPPAGVEMPNDYARPESGLPPLVVGGR